MYCKNCGGQINENQDICLSCGASVGKGNSYCRNCGKKISEFADICVGCGVFIKKEELDCPVVDENLNKKKSFTRSLSVIPQVLLACLSILFLMVEAFYKDLYKSGLTSSSSTDTWNVNDYSFMDLMDIGGFFLIFIVVIVLIATTLIMSFVCSFKNKNVLGWIGFGTSVASLILIGAFSLIASVNYSYSTTWRTSVYGYSFEWYSQRAFGGFSILFYVELLLCLLMAIIALLDALDMPLLKKKNSVIE